MSNVLILNAGHVIMAVILHFCWILQKVNDVVVGGGSSDVREWSEGWCNLVAFMLTVDHLSCDRILSCDHSHDHCQCPNMTMSWYVNAF